MTDGIVVVRAFFWVGIRGHLAVSFRVKPSVSPPRQHLVGVGLVGDVPDDFVSWCIKDAVVGNSQFDDAQV